MFIKEETVERARTTHMRRENEVDRVEIFPGERWLHPYAPAQFQILTSGLSFKGLIVPPLPAPYCAPTIGEIRLRWL